MAVVRVKKYQPRKWGEHCWAEDAADKFGLGGGRGVTPSSNTKKKKRKKRRKNEEKKRKQDQDKKQNGRMSKMTV